MDSGWWKDVPDCAPWRTAASLDELGTLTARWLGGDLQCSPFQGLEPPDEETDEVVEPLIVLNESGFVTDFSQPGELDDGWDQRAAVSGFCNSDVAESLSSLSTSTSLLVLAYSPGVEYLVHVPVTRNQGNAHTWCGMTIPAGQAMDHHFGHLLSPEALLVLETSWQVRLIDLEWGRHSLLWETAVAAVTG